MSVDPLVVVLLVCLAGICSPLVVAGFLIGSEAREIIRREPQQ